MLDCAVKVSTERESGVVSIQRFIPAYEDLYVDVEYDSGLSAGGRASHVGSDQGHTSRAKPCKGYSTACTNLPAGRLS